MDQDEESTSTELPQVAVQVPEAVELNSHPQQLRFSCSSICAFAKQDYTELDAAERSDSTKKLFVLTIFLSVVMIIEIIGGLKSHSLAVLTDAAHILSDIAGFSISLFTVWVSGWKSTPQQSFGFNRLEVLGALVSVQLIWLISGLLIYEAIDRLLHKNAKVDGTLMFAVAAFGLLVNCVMIFWLGHDHSHHGHSHNSHHGQSHHDHSHHGHGHHDHSHHGHSHDSHNHEHHHHKLEESCSVNEDDTAHLVESSGEKTKIRNINIQGAYLHIMTDLIQSVGVMIAGSIIWLKPEWLIVDLFCTLIFSVLALSATLPMLKSIFTILMERTPGEIDPTLLEKGLKNIKGVDDVHDLHVWAITAGKSVMACHVVISSDVNSNDILFNIREYCEKTFSIHHVTIQIEHDIC